MLDVHCLRLLQAPLCLSVERDLLAVCTVERSVASRRGQPPAQRGKGRLTSTAWVPQATVATTGGFGGLGGGMRGVGELSKPGSYIYIYVYIFIYVCIYMYIYIYRESHP